MATHSLDLESSSAQYASIASGSQTGLALSGSFTIEAWVIFESLGVRYIAERREGSSNNQNYYLWYSGTELALGFRDTGGTIRQVYVSSGLSFATGTQYHICGVFDDTANTLTLYVDGYQVGQLTGVTQTPQSSGSQELRVGAECAVTSTSHDGLLKDVRIFNSARSISEIRADMHIENVSSGSLVAEWNFNNDYLDTTTNNNDLSGVNSPTFSTTLPDYNLYRIYPSMDGHIRNSGATYATVQSAATGNSVQDTDPDALTQNTVDAGTYYITRSVFIFDTSILPDTMTVSSATLHVKDTNSSFSNTDTDTLTVVSASPASDSSLSTADFDAFGTTSYGSLALSSRVANAYNTITLNADGLAAIAKTGNTRLGLRMAKDISATQPTGINRMAFYSVNRTGIGEDPYLEIVVSDTVTALPSFFLNFV